MTFKSIQRLSSALIVDAPATADLSLAMACCSLAAADHTIVWDKNFLDGYEGEKGYGPATRLLVLTGSTILGWAAIGGLYSAVQVYLAAH